MINTYIERLKQRYEKTQVTEDLLKECVTIGYFPSNGTQWYNNQYETILNYQKFENLFDQKEQNKIEEFLESVFGNEDFEITFVEE